MKLITRFLYLSAAGIMLLTSCAKEQTESYDKFENQALEAWMTCLLYTSDAADE